MKRNFQRSVQDLIHLKNYQIDFRIILAYVDRRESTMQARYVRPSIYIKRIGNWMRDGIRHYLIHLIVFAVLIAIVLNFSFISDIFGILICEPTIRIFGLLLQLSGFGIVIRGLRQKRKLFSMPSTLSLFARYFQNFCKWVRAFPSFRTTIVDLKAHSITLPPPVLTRPELEVVLDPNAPIEKRLTLLEEKYKMTVIDIRSIRSDIDDRHYELNITIANISRKALSDTEKLKRTIKNAVASNVYIDQMGVFFFVMGTLLAGLSSELVQFLISLK